MRDGTYETWVVGTRENIEKHVPGTWENMEEMLSILVYMFVDGEKGYGKKNFGFCGVCNNWHVRKKYLVYGGLICMFNLGLEIDRVNV